MNVLFPYCNAIGEGNKLDTTEMSTSMLPEKSMQKPSDALQEFYIGSPQWNSSNHNQNSGDDQHMSQKFDQVVNGDEDLTTLAELCPGKVKGDAQIEEAVSSKGDSYKDNISSFSATSRNIKPNLVDGSLEDVRLHDEVSTSDLHTHCCQ
ncbi:hypothetical protein HPP92_017628 [Vanilla planifolia]|uniref:Uncharacterized protein n=1 Tax=Vanilla planifolia TaxID=51239 RepID=A0A835QCQ8_VANPL|nr:hypothetical protein HPP92_017628 [Vanilla planifolia]